VLHLRLEHRPRITSTVSWTQLPPGAIVMHKHSSSPSLTSALDGVVGQRHAPAALPPRNTQYPLYRKLGGPQGRSGRVRKISLPPEFDPRTVQPVASHYTDCVIQPHGKSNGITIFKFSEILKKAKVFGNSSDRRASVLGDAKATDNQMRNRIFGEVPLYHFVS
jgi:hypothetical protein